MREVRSGLVFFGISVIVLWESVQAGLGTSQKPGSGFISFYTGGILAVLSLMLVYQGWGSRKSQEPYSLRVILALASLFVYSLVMDTLGFIVATFFLMVIFFRLGERRTWQTLLGMSALVTFLVYLLFGIVLQVYLPQGFLRI